MKKFAVIGDPIQHSLSPEIHQLFSSQHRETIEYKKILSTKENFAEDVKTFFKDGGLGMNVTIPFKEDAFILSDNHDEISKICSVSNTLYSQDGKIMSYNTDGTGLLNDLSNKSIKIENREILVIGAGGSSKSILHSLSRINPASLTVLNRTQEKIASLQENLKINTQIRAFEEGIDFDLIINTTPISMLESEISFPDSIFKKGSTSYDLFYSQSKTKFQLWSEKCGASESYNGIGMLIEQAALSYEIWNNYKPKTEKIAGHLGF